MHPKDADGMANSVDPDQTASSVLSWSALFAETYLSLSVSNIKIFLCVAIIFGSLDFYIVCTEQSRTEQNRSKMFKSIVISCNFYSKNLPVKLIII